MKTIQRLSKCGALLFIAAMVYPVSGADNRAAGWGNRSVLSPKARPDGWWTGRTSLQRGGVQENRGAQNPGQPTRSRTLDPDLFNSPQANNGSTAEGNGQRGNGVDRRFLAEAAATSLAEITAGHFAQTNFADDALREFGATLVQDHSDSRAMTEALAGQVGANVPRQPKRADARRVQSLARLPETRSATTFLDMMVRDHARAIQQFTMAAQRASHAAVREYARSQLPILAEHLRMALALRDVYTTEQGTQQK